jgi:hypothetical protein
MKAVIQLVSKKDASLTPYKKDINLNIPRPTEAIGGPIRVMCEKVLKNYKQPMFELIIDGEVRGQVEPKGKMMVDKIASVNFAMAEILINTRFTDDEMLYGKATKDKVALGIAKAFGHEGTTVTARAAAGNILALEKAMKVEIKWTKVDMNDKYRKSVDPRILVLEDNAQAERKTKALAAKNKPLQITAGN